MIGYIELPFVISVVIVHVVLTRNNVGIRDFTNPDVAELRRIVVILNLDRFAIRVGLILGSSVEEGIALDFPVILNNNAVEQDGDRGRTNDFGDVFVTVFVFFRAENRSREDNVVSLPFSGLLHGVDIRRKLLIDRTALTFVISGIFIGIKNLEFIVIHEEDTAVAASLSLSIGVGDGRAREFEVELAAAELLFGEDRTSARMRSQNAVGDVPFTTFPSVHIGSVEEDDSVGRSVGGFFTRSDHRRFFPVDTHAEVTAVEFPIVILGINRRDCPNKTKNSGKRE